MRIITIAGRKGGIKKTTTTVNTAYELSQKGKRVLIVDFDGQGDATSFYRRDKTDFYVADVLLDRKFDISKAIYPAVIKGQEQDNLFIIPARCGDVMSKLNMDMVSLPKREERLLRHLENVQDKFDFVLIDTSPETSILSMNAVIAADEFIFPTTFTDRSFEGIDVLIEHIQDAKFIDEDEIDYLILPVGIDKRVRSTYKYGREYLAERFPHNVSQTTIWHRQSDFENAELDHLPVSVYKSSSPTAMYYKNFAKEVIDNEF
ncbi:ParA family protein [Aliivibrio fischeri]